MADQKVYLMGIGGMGMVSLAGLFKQKGWEVCGSDQNVYPPASDELAQLGATVFEGYDPDNLSDDIDLVVVGNVISFGHTEFERVLEKKIPYTSMAQAIATHFLGDRDSIVVTGTHGKTTTSSFMSFLLNELHQNPGYFIGGIPNQLKKGYQLGVPPYFVLEGDEYDTACFEKTPKFLHYKPKHVLITSIEFDHADIYANLDEIMKQFDHLLDIVPEDGSVLACGDDENIQKLIRDHKSQVPLETYGSGPNNDWALSDLQINENQEWVFDVKHKGVFQDRIVCGLGGEYNAKNTLACYALLRNLGLASLEIVNAISLFKGVKRRQELVGVAGGVTIYDDFAHHPTAVEKTVGAFRKRFPDAKLWAIFEPRSNTSRRAIFQDRWAQSFDGADAVVVAPVYEKKDSLENKLDIEKLMAELESKGKQVHVGQSYDDIHAHLLKQAKHGDVFLFMSNGNFGNLPRRLRDSLES